jgi:hypothetical protein
VNFLSAGFLWALPMVAGPVLIHLINRRPPQRKIFSHIAWLSAVHRATMPRKRLKDRLLLIARTLLVLFLILFFARPVVNRGVLASSENSEAIVVLLDVSASMGVVESGRSGLESAKERVLSAVRRLPAGAALGLVTFSDEVESELAPTPERNRFAAALQSAPLTYRATDMRAALALGYDMLSHQTAKKRTLLIAGDQARHAWRGLLNAGKPADHFDPQVRVIFFEAVPAVDNKGFISANLRFSEEGSLHGHAEARGVDVGNDFPWKLSLNGRVAAQGQKTPVDFTVSLPEGGAFDGVLETRADAAPFDDAYYVAGRLPKGFRVLLIDGASAMAPADAETYYLKSALESPRDPRIESLDVIRPESLPGVALDSYRVIVLANVGTLGALETEVLRWVQNGGGLLVSAGTQWAKPPAAPLGLLRTHALVKNGERVNPPPKNGVIAQALSNSEAFEWPQISVSSYFQPEAIDPQDVLLTLENGDPLLIQKSVGQGRVLFLTTSLSRAWTTLPSKPAFAPLMRELIAMLADPLRRQTSLQLNVGEPVRLPVSKTIRSAAITAPDGVVSAARVNDDGVLEWNAVAKPGVYRVQSQNSADAFSFAVNIPDLEHEGDLARVSNGDLRAAFPNAPIQTVFGKSSRPEALSAALQGRDLTNLFLTLALLMFALETALILLSMPARAAVAALLLLSLAPAARAANHFEFRQLKYDGAWDPYPNVQDSIFQMVHTMTNIPFDPERVVVTLKSPQLFDNPFLIIKGNAAVSFDAEEKRQLKTFIDRGGLVFVDDTLCNPKGPFSESIHRLFAELFPDRAFQKLALDHAVFRSFFLLRTVSGRRIAEKWLEGLDVSAGLGGENRTAVIYCPNDLLGAWVKDNIGQYVYSCEPGGEAQRWEALKLTINIIYFSLTGTYKNDAIHQPFIERKLGT